MITTNFNRLDKPNKLIYFEAAINPVLQQLLQEELELIQTEILTLEKRSEESESTFILRFNTLKINYKLLTDFLTINKEVVKEIQDLNPQ